MSYRDPRLCAVERLIVATVGCEVSDLGFRHIRQQLVVLGKSGKSRVSGVLTNAIDDVFSSDVVRFFSLWTAPS